MKIAVCVKSVPDSNYYDKIKMDPETNVLIRKGIPTVISGADKTALEAALELREKVGGTVVVVSMGPGNARMQLLETLAMGADEAYLASDRKFGGADTLGTSYVLSETIKKIGGVDLVIAGNDSDDGATSHVPTQIGEWMNVPHMMDVVAVDADSDDAVKVSRKFENGVGNYKISTPCVISVKRGINDIRYATVKGILTAKDKPYTVFTYGDFEDIDDTYLGLAGSPSQSSGISVVDDSRNRELLEGSADEIAEAIIEKMNTLVDVQ